MVYNKAWYIAYAGSGINILTPFNSDKLTIYNNIIELSSGSNMLTRIIKKSLVAQYVDEVDKRVKRLKVTAKGEKTLMKTKELLLDVARRLLRDVSDADKQLCLHLLKPSNDRYSGLYQQQKTKPFKAIYLENMA